VSRGPRASNELLEGNLSRGILRLAVPMLASSLLQNAQSLINLFWVGRLGASAVAALALSGTILMMLFPIVMGMAAGNTVIPMLLMAWFQTGRWKRRSV